MHATDLYGDVHDLRPDAIARQQGDFGRLAGLHLDGHTHSLCVQSLRKRSVNDMLDGDNVDDDGRRFAKHLHSMQII